MKTYSVETLNNSILPLCHGYEKPVKSIKVTLGNTLAFRHHDGLWLLTCRHLMEKAWQENMLKSVWLSEDANYFLMWKKRDHLQYHPSDTPRHTRDLALYYFSKLDNEVAQQETWSWDPEYSELTLQEDEPLMVMGIPSEQMTPESVVSSKPLPVEQIEGVYLDNTLSFSPEDYNRTLADQQLVQVPLESLAELSGGLVVAKRAGGWYPRGIVTGTGTVKVKKTEDAAPQEVGIYTYTDFRHLRELFNPMEDDT